MAFHLGGTHLRVVRKYSLDQQHRITISRARLIIVEHILPTTEQFIGLLNDAGSDIFAIFAKPYSIDRRTAKRMQRYRVLFHSYDELENPQLKIIDTVVRGALEKSRGDGRQVILIDVGGYFAQPVLRLQETDDLMHLGGIVEDTTFGHNRYLAVASQIKVPIFSVARSRLKEIEARFVGRDAFIAADSVLREIGVLLSGRSALVLGYGMIGSNVARSLRANDLNVSVYDKCDHKNLRAYIDGFQLGRKRDLITQSDIIFSATATTALTLKEIEECKDGAILASVGSKNSEFDISALKRQAVKYKRLAKYLDSYKLSNSKDIRVIKDGTALNFILPSLPVEIMDLVFSEILTCIMLLLNPHSFNPGVVHVATSKHLDDISLDWLRVVIQ